MTSSIISHAKHFGILGFKGQTVVLKPKDGLTRRQTKQLNAILTKMGGLELYERPVPSRKWSQFSGTRYEFDDDKKLSFVILPAGDVIHEKLRGKLLLEKKDSHWKREFLSFEDALQETESEKLRDILETFADRFLEEENFDLIKKN